MHLARNRVRDGSAWRRRFRTSRRQARGDVEPGVDPSLRHLPAPCADSPRARSPSSRRCPPMTRRAASPRGSRSARAGAHAHAARFFAAARSRGYTDSVRRRLQRGADARRGRRPQRGDPRGPGNADSGARRPPSFTTWPRGRMRVPAGFRRPTTRCVRPPGWIQPPRATTATSRCSASITRTSPWGSRSWTSASDTGRESFPLHVQRGVLLAMKGLMEQAEPEFDRARQLAPESAVPYVALAMAWMQTGQTPRAVDMLRERARGPARPRPSTTCSASR